MRFRLSRDIPGLGIAGDIVSLPSIPNIPGNVHLELIESDEVEKILDALEAEPEMDHKRACQVIDSRYVIHNKKIYRKEAFDSIKGPIKES